jgi:hypothetical protein
MRHKPSSSSLRADSSRSSWEARGSSEELIALIVGLLAAIGATVTILFFWRKKQGSWDATWRSAKDTATSFGKTAADQAGHAADKAAALADGAGDAASHAVDEVKSQLGAEG